MPSPFPGMDPWLEAPDVWPAVHSLLISGLVRMLNPLLPRAYIARPGERVYVVEDQCSTFPDAAVTRHASQRPLPPAQAAVIESDPPLVLVAEPVEVRESFVEIRRADGPGRVVACVEILSPRNKAVGHAGRDLYLRKQEERLASATHLIEIDLLRQWPHTAAAPEGQIAEHGPWHYVVSLHRGGDGERYEVWPTTVRDRLRRFHIPLEEPDPAVVVDLQTLLDVCYDEGAFGRQLDYSADPPPPPFDRADAEWIREFLREVRAR